MATPDVCYNDCTLNRTPSGKLTRCYICQLYVHNVCLGVPKKTIGTGAWTCTNCRKMPENIDILRDLIVGLCDKVNKLESVVSSLSKNTSCNTNSSTQTSGNDKTLVSIGTSTEPIHYDLIDLSTCMQPENTSATVSYLNEMLDDMAVESYDNDDIASNSNMSSESHIPSDHQHVYIGNTSVGTTRDELFALLCHIGVKNIINIDTVSKFDRQYVSFCVTVANRDDADSIYEHPWRCGIIVEPSRKHRAMNRRSTTDYGTPTSYRRRTPRTLRRNHHLGPRYRRSLVSATDYGPGSDTPPPGTQQHTRRRQALSRESSPPSAHPYRSQNREANYALHRRSPPEESTTSGAPHNYSRKGKATSGAHRRRSPLREYAPSCANFRHSSTSEATSGAHTIRPQAVPTTPTALQKKISSSHPHALPHMPHVPTSEHKETERVTTNTITRPEDNAILPIAPNPAVEQTTQKPPAVNSAAMSPWVMPPQWIHPAMLYQYAHMLNVHVTKEQLSNHQVAPSSNAPVQPQHNQPTAGTDVVIQPGTTCRPIPIHMSTPSRPAQ